MEPRIRTSDQGFVNSPHKIYAGNLGWNITSQGLREAFEDCPGLLSAKVVYDRDSGRSRGFGFVTFSSAEEVETALNAMNGLVRLSIEKFFSAEWAPSYVVSEMHIEHHVAVPAWRRNFFPIMGSVYCSVWTLLSFRESHIFCFVLSLITFMLLC